MLADKKNKKWKKELTRSWSLQAYKSTKLWGYAIYSVKIEIIKLGPWILLFLKLKL